MAEKPAVERAINQIKFATIHHSAVFQGAKNQAEAKQRASAYDSLHKSHAVAGGWSSKTRGEYGYQWVSYHVIIAKDGSITQLQDWKYARMHAGDWGLGANSSNQWGIAILVDGYFHAPHNEKPNQKQIDAIAKVIIDFEKSTGVRIQVIDGHRDRGATACPGDHLYPYLPEIRAKVVESRGKPAENQVPIMISVQNGDGYSHIAKRAGWIFWDDAPRVISELTKLNPNHPSFKRGNKLWASDPAFIVGYKTDTKPVEPKPEPKPTPTPTPEPEKPQPAPEPQISYGVYVETKQNRFFNKQYETLELAQTSYELSREIAKKISVDEKSDVYVVLEEITDGVAKIISNEVIEYEEVSLPEYIVSIHGVDYVEEVLRTLSEYEAKVMFQQTKSTLEVGETVVLEMLTLTDNILLNDYTKPMETQTGEGGRPHNKFLERKFIIAIVAPILSIVLNALGLMEYLNEYVNYAVDMLLWSAPILWIYIEGKLDEAKIKRPQ